MMEDVAGAALARVVVREHDAWRLAVRAAGSRWKRVLSGADMAIAIEMVEVQWTIGLRGD